MATLKQRVHRYNGSSYDTIHYETSSELVLRPSGRTVEQDLTDYLPKVQDNDTAPATLNAGSTLYGINKAWFGGYNGDIREIKTSSGSSGSSIAFQLLAEDTLSKSYPTDAYIYSGTRQSYTFDNLPNCTAAFLEYAPTLGLYYVFISATFIINSISSNRGESLALTVLSANGSQVRNSNSDLVAIYSATTSNHVVGTYNIECSVPLIFRRHINGSFGGYTGNYIETYEYIPDYYAYGNTTLNYLPNENMLSPDNAGANPKVGALSIYSSGTDCSYTLTAKLYKAY